MKFSKSFFVAAALCGIANAFNGDVTFYYPRVATGACGWYNNDNELVAALSIDQYGSGGNCGRAIRVDYQGKSVTVAAVDKCAGCQPNDIDLSPAAFDQLASRDAGRIAVNWYYVN
ncbi:hypothetical protein M413DRAFT_13082 [Hebeloma cylindrosporum]|uniref:RlpA-like protein double-psi beta-barrel domain-containing protein n=1 Tax=Hebeloma cylindrosporum TaxID=76867 RepID=A0A0C3C0T4_HEBCY|nr:hypothetical protein M413DRAFT_13082 [Hebeloma cylindrosporum h7]